MTPWRNQAGCAGLATELFDTDRLPLEPAARADAARALCAGCPVIAECARDAIDNWENTRGHVFAGVAVPSGNRDRNNARYKLVRIAGIVDTIKVRGLSGGAVANSKKTHCINGHEYTEDNTVLVKQRGGTARRCKTCLRVSSRTAKAAQRQRDKAAKLLREVVAA